MSQTTSSTNERASVPARFERRALSAEMRAALRCPRCRGALASGEDLSCGTCQTRYPIVDGVPVLINEANSVFRIGDFLRGKPTTFKKRSLPKAVLARVLPGLSASAQSDGINRRFVDHLLKRTRSPRVLVIGAGLRTENVARLLELPSADVVETDVYLGPRTVLVADAHDLPFEDGTFDAVMAIAVLEHVADPFRCVSEIHRVLAPGGLVVSETPFMQQVHMGAYDFTRFTPLGHRRLFRRFEQLEGGPNGGQGQVLAWSWHHFLRGFATGARGRATAEGIARLTGFWLKYFDRVLATRPGAWDGAKGSYFIGVRSESVLPDRDLLALYGGLDRAGKGTHGEAG